MASSVVPKIGSFHPIFSSAIKLAVLSRPAAGTDVFGRFSSINRRMYSAKYVHYDEVSLTTRETTPRSFKREDTENVYLFVDMPGITKHDVKAIVERKDYRRYDINLDICGKSVKEYECESRNYSSTFVLPENKFKTSDIKAKIEYGVLKVTLPKLKEVKGEDTMSEEFEVEVD